jgi:hypothetical protein
MSDSKKIDLRPYKITRIVDVRVIRTIGHVHTQNGELSHVVVYLKTGEELKGHALLGSNAVHESEKLFQIWQQKLGGG